MLRLQAKRMQAAAAATAMFKSTLLGSTGFLRQQMQHRTNENASLKKKSGLAD